MAYTDQQIQSDPYLSQLNSWLYSGVDSKGLNDKNRSDWATSMTNLTDQFKSSFANMVGRGPTDEEVKQFSTRYIQPNVGNLTNPNSAQSQDPYTYLNQFISNNYQNAAKDYATQQLTAQQGQANSLADMFRKNGNQAINNTEQSLLDYQSKLFEKLRPSLLTSLQSQGLLDTGGLNSAIAGSQADLANSVQPFLANARLSNEQQANAISQSGAAAPLQYQQGNIMNQVPYLQGQGQQAMQQGYNTFLTNLNYQNQLGLQSHQAQLQEDMQPGLLGRMGQSFVSNFGSAAGQKMGTTLGDPNTYAKLLMG